MSALRIGPVELRHRASQLSDRDWAVLRFIRQHRYATTAQLRRMFFTAHANQAAATRACIRVLDRLVTQRILTRLDRRVGGVGHGSAAFIWGLDIVGDRLTKSKEDSRWRAYEPSAAFLAHMLAVTETHVQLQEAATAGAFSLKVVQVETEAWRTYVASHGATSILKPDLMVTISSEAYDDHWYLEVDLGTESLPVLLRKCRAYEEYRRTGRAQAEHGVFPRVLWVLLTRDRVTRLNAAIAAELRFPDRLFTCVTSEEVVSTLRNPV